VETEPHLLWIAREGVVAPVPPPWKACHNLDAEHEDEIFYFNFETAESVWDHPCDQKYRSMVEDARAEFESRMNHSGGSLNSSGGCERTVGAGTPPAVSRCGLGENDNKKQANGSSAESGVSPTTLLLNSQLGSGLGGGALDALMAGGIPVRRLDHIQEEDDESGSFGCGTSGSGTITGTHGLVKPRVAVKIEAVDSDEDERPKKNLDTEVGLTGPRVGLGGARGAGVEDDEDEEAFDDDFEQSASSAPSNSVSASVSASASASANKARKLVSAQPRQRGGQNGGRGDSYSDSDRSESSSSPRSGRQTKDCIVGVADLAAGAPNCRGSKDPLPTFGAATPSPSKGLAGVGLAPSSKAAGGDDDRPDVMLQSPGERSGSHASEISEDFPSQFDNSGLPEEATPGGSRGGGAGSKLGDTLEFSVTVDGEEGSSAVVAAAGARGTAAAEGLPASLAGTKGGLQSQLDSLARSLEMLKNIRSMQQEYMQLLHAR